MLRSSSDVSQKLEEQLDIINEIRKIFNTMSILGQSTSDAMKVLQELQKAFESTQLHETNIRRFGVELEVIKAIALS